MAGYNRYKDNLMKRLLLLVFTFVIFSCSNQSDDPFSVDFLLDHTGWYTSPLNSQIADPYWDSESSFWTAYDHENRILTKLDMEGNTLDTITLYLYPDAPSQINDPYVSTDGSTIVFTTEIEDTEIRDVNRIKIDTADHSKFTYDGVDNIRLPNLSDLYITSPIYPWTDKMGYLGTSFDENTMTGTQNFYIYDFTTGITQSIFLGIYGFDDAKNITDGEYYYNPDVYTGSDSLSSIEMIMFCVRLETEDGSAYTVKMISSDGSVSYDGSSDFLFDNIGAIRWIDENTLLMTVEENGRWKVISGNEDTDIHEYYTAEKDVYALKGLSVSPSMTKCVTQISYHEYSDKNDLLFVSLFQD